MVAAAAGLLVAALWLAANRPAVAADDGRKVALELLSAAKYYYKKGDFERAAARFLEAYRIDARPEYLFNAARAEQRGMKLQHARRHFEALLALPELPDQVRSRATMHLQEIRAMQAAIAAARKRGAVETAGKLEDRARRDGASGARDKELEGMAGIREHRPDEPRAQPAGAPDLRASRSGSSATGSPSAPTSRAPAVAATPVRLPTRTPPGSSALWLAYGLAGAGAIGAGVGVVMILQASSDLDALNAKTADRNGGGDIVGIDYGTYESGLARVNGTRRVGVVAGGVGVVAVGVGVVIMLRHGGGRTAWFAPAAGGRGLVAGARF